MEKADEKPKVRIVKAGQHRPRSGVIRIQDKNGRTWYRTTCDRCNEMAKESRQPLQGQEVVCSECRWIAAKGKPSTQVRRKHGKVQHFTTECDLCGDRQKTPFLPKQNRPFLCDGCFEEEKKNTAMLEPKQETAGPDDAARTEPDDSARTEPEDSAGSKANTSPWKEPVKRFQVTCRRCRNRVELRFLPPPDEYFMCKSCYMDESTRKEQRKDRPDIQTWFNIECAACGKLETVDFVPQDLTEPMCTSCFEKRKKRR